MSDIDELIRKRLENLRGASSSKASASSSAVLPKENKKPAQEQVEDLLKQLADETAITGKIIDKSLDIDTQIKARLERLKSRDDCDFQTTKSSVISKVTKNEDIVDEAFFDKASTCDDLLADLGIGSDNDSDTERSDCSDTCCALCNENKPTLMCIDCDKDYYCRKCYEEYHSDDDEHKAVPYKKS